MTYERVTVILTEHEMEKLRKVAQHQLRRPRDQAAFILRQVLLDETVEGNSNSDATRLEPVNAAVVGIVQ